MEISLSHARYEEIKRIVVNLFVRYDVRCIPVSAFEVATKMGIPLIPYSATPENKRYLLFKESEDGFVVEKEVVNGTSTTMIKKTTEESIIPSCTRSDISF